MSKAEKLSEAQVKLLVMLSVCKKAIKGPSPEYQGDCVHLTAPELHELVGLKMVGRRKMAAPYETEGHPSGAAYLRFTHRYRILKAGRAALPTPDGRGRAG